MKYLLSNSWNTPPSNCVPAWIGQCSKKNPRFSFLSADLIRVRKAGGPPCRIVVNRDSFRHLGLPMVPFPLAFDSARSVLAVKGPLRRFAG